MGVKKYTNWHPANIVPKNIGAYQKQCSDRTIGYQYWSGAKWGGFSDSPAMAFVRRDMHTQFISDPWRGLINRPPLSDDESANTSAYIDKTKEAV